MGVDISVIIPTYNEEENVEELYKELKTVISSLKQNFEIIFVDDCSTDTTNQRLLELHTKDPGVKIIKFRKNFGQSAAMKAGFDYAQGRLIITMDADLQNDPHDIPMMIEKIEHENFDVVCGWRYNRKDPALKTAVSKLANRFRSILTGETIHDSGCTLRIYKQEAIRDIELYGELHRYIPAMLLWKGYRIGEIKTNHRQRVSGKSKYSWKRLTKGFLDLLVIAFWQKYSFRPMHIFGGSGLIMGFVGFCITAYLILERLLFGAGLSERPLFLIGILLIIVGVQFLAIGLLADIMLKVYYGQNQRKSYLIEKITGL
jgi:glycosyltransferase involved in cell wall biosynthesis